MFKKIEKKITDFVADQWELVERQEMVHGSLYVKLKAQKDCDHFHRVLRTFFKKEVDDEGGVNMYALSEEFVFDFVPGDREAPVFSDADYSGKEDMNPTDLDLTDEQESELDVLMNLEAEAVRGK